MKRFQTRLRNSAFLLLTSLFTSGTLPVFATYYITTPTNWTSPMTISDDVVVQNGASLTIGSNATVLGSIFVRPGGRLNINNCTLIIRDKITAETDYTNLGTATPGAQIQITNATLTPTASIGHWLGIEVWGMTTLAQTSPAVAKLTMNNVLLEKAHVALTNFKEPYMATFSTKHAARGGIINARNTTIKNCTTGLFMKPFKNPMIGTLQPADQSSFILCTFLATQAPPPSILDVEMMNNFVTLQEVEGISFRGCTFERQGDFQPGTAIYATRSGLTLSNYCSGFSTGILGSCSGANTPGTFKNVGLCAMVTNDFTYQKVSVTDCNFTNCNKGLYISGSIGAVVCRNSMNYSSYPAYAGAFKGITLQYCSGFKVEENNISLPGYGGWDGTFGSGHSPAYGIIISGAGESNNDVYRNTIFNVDYALLALGTNRTPYITYFQTGLRFLCNNITSDIDRTDIVASVPDFPFPDAATPSTGLAQFQRQYMSTGSFATGNYLDNKPFFSSTQHIFNDANPFSYYYSTANSRENPLYKSSNVDKFSDQPAVCASRNINITTLPAKVEHATAIKGMIASGITGGTLTPGDISGLMMQYNKIANDAMLSQLYVDSSGYHPDSLALIWSDMSYNFEFKVLEAAAYATKRNFQQAGSTLDAISTEYQLDVYQTQRIDNLKFMYQVLSTLEGTAWEDLSNTIKSRVEAIAQGDTYFARGIARNVMGINANVMYDFDAAVIPQDAAQVTFRQQVPVTSGKNLAYPNPVADMLFIMAQEGQSLSNAFICDLSGKSIRNIPLHENLNRIDVHDLVAGIYFLKLVSGNKTVHVEKLVKK